MTDMSRLLPYLSKLLAYAALLASIVLVFSVTGHG
tara:strand:+ start:1573 stop:1677 length:105 start_codon:yes stop_codon:yes gene_type:complete